MKIKLDENMPRRLVEAITGMGHDVHTVPGEGLTGRDDETVWEAAQREGRFLVTQDMDFSRPLAASHHGVLLVRLRECGRGAVFARVRDFFAMEDPERWRGRLVTLTDHKVRVFRGGEGGAAV